MKLVKKIGNITLDRPIEWTNFDSVQSVMAETVGTINGGAITYELAMQDTAKKIDLASGSNYGSQSATTKDAILALANGSLGTTTTITTYEDDVINVRFRHEDNAVEVEDLIGARQSNVFGLTIRLARV
jgi:hypothetical protein